MIGKLRQRVTFLKRTLDTNAIGEAVEKWEDYIAVWAEVKPNTGSRFYSALQSQTNIKGTITIRYRPDIDTTMRIRHGSEIYTINSIINVDSANKYLQIMYES